MLFPIRQLFDEQQKLVTATLEGTMREVLADMVEHDYSQLPVVDQDGKPIGMVTSDSLLAALNIFALTTDKLRVIDALVRARVFHEDADVFDLLKDLRDNSAVLIVNDSGVLIRVVTSYDTTEYFRWYAEDLMLVEKIENTLKTYILAPLAAKKEDAAQQELNEFVKQATGGQGGSQGKFRSALCRYLELEGQAATPISRAHVETAYREHLHSERVAKPFDQLTLQEYINLFLYPARWHLYKPYFDIDPSAIRRRLERVRDVRNQLVHFRGRPTPLQRQELRLCLEWLVRSGKGLREAFSVPEEAVEEQPKPARSYDTDPATMEAKEGRNTISDRLSQARPEQTDLFQALKAFLLGLGDDVQENARKHYVAFKRTKNFACIEIHPQVKKVTAFVRIDPDTVVLEEGFTRDVRGIGHFGTGDLEITIRKHDDLEKAKPLLTQSYEMS